MLTNKQESFLKAKTVETGLSDFHKMVVSVFKTSFKKQKPKMQTYRDYKRFDNEKFRESLIAYFSTGKNISYDAFEKVHLKTLGTQTGYLIGVFIWVVVKINVQTGFRFILLSRKCQPGSPN